MRRIKSHSCKITGFMMLSVGLSLIAPTIIETTNILSNLRVNCVNQTQNVAHNSSVHLVMNGLNIKYRGWQAPLNCEYHPQNYGAPDSWHGSGTR